MEPASWRTVRLLATAMVSDRISSDAVGAPGPLALLGGDVAGWAVLLAGADELTAGELAADELAAGELAADEVAADEVAADELAALALVRGGVLEALVVAGRLAEGEVELLPGRLGLLPPPLPPNRT